MHNEGESPAHTSWVTIPVVINTIRNVCVNTTPTFLQLQQCTQLGSELDSSVDHRRQPLRQDLGESSASATVRVVVLRVATGGEEANVHWSSVSSGAVSMIEE